MDMDVVMHTPSHKMADMVAFLRNLTYGENNTPGLSETYERWREIGKGRPGYD